MDFANSREHALLPRKNMPRDENIIVGIDEAGRGPILGPLVLAALAFKEEDIQKLEWLGVKDSKLLGSEVREELFDRIHEIVHDFRIEMIEPDAIDLSLTEMNTNLNWLEADTAARMAGELQPMKLIVDCPSPNIEAYRKYFLGKIVPPLSAKAEIIVEHKADLNYIVVGAASIIAKVIRDRQIEKIKREIGIDFGSGYLTDPKTQKFLENFHEKHAELFRKQWMPYKKLLEGKKQKKLGEF